MGCTASTPSTLSNNWVSSFQQPFQGAGCLFHNGSHALIGLHSRNQKHGHVRICGFGGKREADEPWWQTAFRETVEELLEPEHVSFNLYCALASNMSPQRILYDEETRYICAVFSLEDLVTFLRISASYIVSPMYQVFPRSVDDLMFRRGILYSLPTHNETSLDPNRRSVRAEIAEIVLWPMREHHRFFRVTRDVLKDFKAIVGPDEGQQNA